MADDPPPPRRIQPTGRRHQHRLGRGSHLVGQTLGAMGQHRGMGHRELPTKQRHPRSRPADHGTTPGPSAQSWPRRPPPAATGSAASQRSSRPAGPGRPRRPPGHRRQRAAGASGLPAGPPTPAGPGPARPTPHRSAGPGPGRPTRPRPPPAASPSGSARTSVECVFESMAVTYQPGTRTQPPSAKLGTTLLAGVGGRTGRSGAAGIRASCWLADGPQGPTHRAK